MILQLVSKSYLNNCFANLQRSKHSIQVKLETVKSHPFIALLSSILLEHNFGVLFANFDNWKLIISWEETSSSKNIISIVPESVFVKET